MVSTRVLFNPWLDSALAVGAVVTLAARVILQGAYSASDGLMADSLRAQGWLPQSEPYTAMGYAAVGDMATETMAAGIYARTGPTAITDWVWLELRSSSDPTQVLATRSALLQRDGWIKDMDGLSPVSFRHVFAGRYYVVIKHRNHLAAMTAGPIGLSAGSVATVDFSSPSAATYGVNALTAINGVMALWAGDANGDGRISYMGTNNDKDAVLALIGPGNPNNSVSGYQQADCNLDGKVKYNGAANDKTIILNNVGVNTPDNILTAQLP